MQKLKIILCGLYPATIITQFNDLSPSLKKNTERFHYNLIEMQQLNFV